MLVNIACNPPVRFFRTIFYRFAIKIRVKVRVRLQQGTFTHEQYSRGSNQNITWLAHTAAIRRKDRYSSNYIRNYEKNKSELNFATIDLFTKTFGINTDWLIFGRGPMHSSDTPISHQETITQPEATIFEPCVRCAKLESKLEKVEEQRDSLMEENRNLWKENGELREKCARRGAYG
ncbi:MAG: hypothetical protein ACLSAH_15875 [Bilophila wadsworthia]